MAKLSIVAGATSQSITVFVLDNSKTDGSGLTAVAPAGGSLLAGTVLYYSFGGANAGSVVVSLSVLATVGAAWSSGGIVTIDDTHMQGQVRIDIPNAALVSGKGRFVTLQLSGGTHMAVDPIEIELTGWDNQNANNGGLGVLPTSAVPGAANGILIAGTNVATTINGLTLAGTAASGATPATSGLTVTGGAASTTSGGTSAPAASLTGGAGAATTNGAAAGLTATAGGTTTVSGSDGATFTGTGNGNGVSFVHAGSGLDLNAQTTNSLQVDIRKILGTASAGAAGSVSIDWAHVVNPSSTVGLSNTTILTVSGSVGSVAGNVSGSVGSISGVTFPTNFGLLVVDGSGRVDLGKWIGVAPNALVQGKVDATAAIRSGTAQAGAGGTITLDAGASGTDQFYRGSKIEIVSGTGAGQSARLIGGYIGSTKVASVVPNWTTNPDSSSVFIISEWCGVDVELWELVTPNTLISGRLDVSVGAYPGNTAQTGDSFARLGAPAGASIAADIAEVEGETDGIAAIPTNPLLASSAPANFGALGITAGGKISEVVLVDTLTTYTNDTPQSGDVYGALTGATTEPTSPATSTDTILNKIKWLFCLGKNKRTQTATTELVRNDADNATIGTSAKSDDGTTFTRGKYS